jgi:hypothetical protein
MTHSPFLVRDAQTEPMRLSDNTVDNSVSLAMWPCALALAPVVAPYTSEERCRFPRDYAPLINPDSIARLSSAA